MVITLKIIFWLFLFIIFYAYIGYGILLYILVKLKSLFSKKKATSSDGIPYEPEVTLFVTAFNEKDYVRMKVENSLELNYPKEKLKLVWVTDGSNDGTPDALSNYPQVTVYHEDERRGK